MKRAAVAAGVVALAALGAAAYQLRCAVKLALWEVPFPVELHGGCDLGVLGAVERGVGEGRERWRDFTGQPLPLEPRPLHLVIGLPVPEHTWSQSWNTWELFEACEGVPHLGLMFQMRRPPDLGELELLVAREMVKRGMVSVNGHALGDWMGEAAIRAVLRQRPTAREREYIRFNLRSGPTAPVSGAPPGSRYPLCLLPGEDGGECRSGGESPWVQPVLEYVRSRRGPAAAREALLAANSGALLQVAAPEGESQLRALDEVLDRYREETFPP